MHVSFTRSASGKRARAPRWWTQFAEGLPKFSVSFLRPRRWNKELAEKWINAIPDKCPFERQVWVGDKLVMYVPPLCPLNPLSRQLYSIKLEAKTYLYDLEKRV